MFTTYKERVYELSQALVQAQKPILILNAIKWGPDVRDHLKRTKFRELPPVDAAYYEKNELKFDPAAKIAEFEALERRIEHSLGMDDPIGAILLRNCREYQTVVRMLVARGKPDFYKYARELYGSPKDHFTDDKTTLKDLGVMLYDVLGSLQQTDLGVPQPKVLTSEQCVDMLNQRFRDYFGADEVRAVLDDGIVSDAAAGSDYVKVRRDAMFSQRDVDILDVHEGRVHVGTTRNGSLQHVATFLAKGPPCTTATQEGLAVLMEVLNFTSLPSRAQRLNNRILAIDKAEDGANLIDIIEFYRTEGLDEEVCINNAERVFRGGVVAGGAPFPKDISYCKGLVANYNFLRTCVQLGHAELIRFMFVGKVAIEDVPVLYAKAREGVVDPPRYVPHPFDDLNGIAIWLGYSNFFNRIDLTAVREKLASLIRR